MLISHGSTGLTVHRVVRQIVVVGERLAHVGGTDCTGDIHTTGDDVLPETLGGVDQPLIAEQPTHMGAGAQVADAHGVAVRGLLAAHVDEVPGKRQVTLLAGLLIQLGEGELNLRVAVGTVNLAFFGAEVGVQTVGHLLGDLKGLLIASHLMVGDGGLDVVTHHIHLVALLNQAEARAVGPYAGLDLIRSVQVAVRLLSAGDEIDRAIAQRLEFGIRMVGQRISGFLKPLVDVGILEHHAAEFVVQFAGDNLQIGDRVAFIVSQLVAGRIVGHCGVDFVVHHSPLVGDDGFDDLVATPLPEQGSDCNVHDCPFLKALHCTASGPAIKDRFQPGSICMAINHLISCGRRHIAIIGGGETYTVATDRTKGALEALAELGIEPAGPIRYGKWDESWGRAATRLLLDQGVTFDAVVCQNDQLARGCIDVLKQQDLRIPDDVAVIGRR